MPMLADQVDGVIGVDTHKDIHVAAACRPTGGVAAEDQAGTDQAGLAGLLAFGRGQVPGTRVWALEGCGSYGAGLAAMLLAAGETVVEVERPARPKRRCGAKSDAIDAARAAKEALGTETAKLARPKHGTDREALRTITAARAAIVESRTAAINLLHQLCVTAPAELRDQLPTGSRTALLRACAALPAQLGPTTSHATSIIASTLADTAARIRDLTAARDRHDRQLAELTTALAPTLLAEPGIGPVSAARLILAYSHHGRIRDQAAFAALSGTSPIPASSGKTTCHRLNRGGDRQLNRALHTIALHRIRHHEQTRAYVARRRAEGKTDRHIRRCIKRYLARHLYRELTHCPALAT